MTSKEAVTLEYRTKWLGMLKDTVLKYVDKDKYAVFLYGSAVNNLVKARDFDIGILGKKNFDSATYLKIYDEIEESIIPIKVDIIDFKGVDKEFKKIALEEIEVWNKPEGISLN